MSEVKFSNKFSVPMGEGRSEKVYDSFDDYRDVILNEHQKWQWLKEQNGKYITLRSCIGNVYFEKLYNVINYGLDAGETYTRLKNFNVNYLPIYSFTPEGVFILQVKEKHGEAVAAMVMFYLGFKVGVDGNSNIKSAIQSAPEITGLASYLAYDFKFGIRSENQSKAYSEALDATYQDYMAQAGKMISEVANVIESTRQMKQEEERKLEKQRTQQKSRFKQTMGRYFFLAKKTKEKLQQQYDAAKADVENAKAAYHEQVDLDASVSYWESRSNSNQRSAFIWTINTVLSLVMTFGSVVFYYILGGLSGLAKHGSLPNQSSDVVEGAANAASSMGLTEHLIVNATGAALLIALMAVIVRICLRQLNTYSHLSLESAERITMVKTYLALLNEGKLKSDQDRHLALDALFRSSQTGMIAETSFNSPVDIVLKTVAEKAGK